MTVAKIHGAEFPVRKIFSNDFNFRIPMYQRPYSWTTEQAGELLADLLEFIGEDHKVSIDDLSPYFLGSIVLIKDEARSDAEVVDGQQRLPAEEVWDHPRRYRGRPFVELIDFPDAAGPAIGSATSAKLHGDFAKFAAKAKRHFDSLSTLAGEQKASAKSKRSTNVEQPDDCSWMWQVYRDFRKAFKVAGDKGLVVFC